MADSNITPGSDQRSGLSTSSGQKANGSGSSKGACGLRGSNSNVKDILKKDIINKWTLDYVYNKSGEAEISQAQFAYYHWTEKLKESQQLEDRKRNEIRDYWTEIYQIVGFYSVFQGVIFQGVTSMATELSCGFYKIPIILSVLASAATFVGIYIKFNNILYQNETLNKDIGQSKRFQDKVTACEELEDVSHFNIEKLVENFGCRSKNGHDSYDEQFSIALVHANYLKRGVLAFLVAFSAIFAYLDFVVMCRGYH